MILPAFLLAVIWLPANSLEASCATVLSRAWWLMMTLARMDGLSNLAERPPRSPQLAQEASISASDGRTLANPRAQIAASV
jgi:hypothetical protein